MSKVICIAGESGSGKTTAMRNLNPEETVYIDCDKKGLSWKGWKQQYNAERKNYFASDFPYKIKAVVAGIDKTRLEIHYIVIDTINGIMVGNLEKTKERKFISGMNRRYKLLFSHPASKVPADAWVQLHYRFTLSWNRSWRRFCRGGRWTN